MASSSSVGVVDVVDSLVVFEEFVEPVEFFVIAGIDCLHSQGLQLPQSGLIAVVHLVNVQSAVTHCADAIGACIGD
jgi:hypothetical protein